MFFKLYETVLAVLAVPGNVFFKLLVTVLAVLAVPGNVCQPF